LLQNGYLTKPFYLPDLFDTIEEVLGHGYLTVGSHLESTGEGYTIEKNKNPDEELQSVDWLEDNITAKKHLTRLLLETAAQAALIVRDDQLWVYAGQLSVQAVHELASIVNNFWHKKGDATGITGDKIRFIRLDVTAVEYLLYVTTLGDELVLALAFDTETPFSKIRTQTVKLARALATPPNHMVETSLSDLHTQRTQAESEEPILPLPQNRNLLGNRPATDTDLHHGSHLSSIDNVAGRTRQQNHTLDAEPQTNSSSEKATKSRGQGSRTIYNQISIGPLLMDDLRPLSPAMHSLSFACLLIPRIPIHHLIGELASSLAQWMGQLCLAYGWRLEHLSIRPGYLLWIAIVSPSTSPSFHIRIIRKHTSRHIFTSFPYLKKENPSGDFWAPGYLIVSSNQPPAANIINQYIERTRFHQGA
jgi:REP element-mobilizing transposase RayT